MMVMMAGASDAMQRGDWRQLGFSLSSEMEIWLRVGGRW